MAAKARAVEMSETVGAECIHWKSEGSAKVSSDEKVTPAKAHAEEFYKRTGMHPKHCFRLILASYTLRMMSVCWMGMVSVEYSRYYVANDVGISDAVRALTACPIHALQAFLFPFLGVVADRLSRKKLLVASSVSYCAAGWMLTLVPSVRILVVTLATKAVSDLGVPIRDAMLCDIFTAEEWELSNGGATGVKARMFLIGQVAMLLAAALGMALLKLGEYGIGLPNEYQLRKAECGVAFCMPPGQFSWKGSWEVDGCLRLLMLLGSIAATFEALVVTLLVPETLRPDSTGGRSVRSFIRMHWYELLRPWNNLRVLATHQLRSLMFIRFLGYVFSAGWLPIFLSFYSRFQFDTFTMTMHTLIAGVSTWLTTAAVPRLVDRFGDLRGVWIPNAIMMIAFGVSCTLLPPGYGHMVFLTYPLLAGPPLGLNMMAPELLPKLIPGDVQGTYQTARAFVCHLTLAVFSWPWNQVFVRTRGLAYPWDGAPLFVGLAVLAVTLWLTARRLRDDPRDALRSGQALAAFRSTGYARGPWYRYHSGSAAACAGVEPESPNPDWCSAATPAQGAPPVQGQRPMLPDPESGKAEAPPEGGRPQGEGAGEIDAKPHGPGEHCNGV